MATALLIAAIALMLLFAWPDRRLRAWELERDRRRARMLRYRELATRSILFFGVSTLVLLPFVGRLGVLRGIPIEFHPLRELTGIDWPVDVFGSIAAGLAGGAVLLAAATWVRRKQGKGVPGTFGNFEMLMPHSRDELPYGVLGALVAAFTEEPFFRVLLPLLLVLGAGLPAWGGFALATIGFGLMHRYQGWVGVLATTLVGVLLSYLYLVSGVLWVPIATHVLIDLIALVLRPILGGAWQVRD